MDIPKNYFHDRLVLLLLSVNAFLTGGVTVWVLLFFSGASQGGQYVVQKRPNLGISAFEYGGVVGVLALIVFAIFVFVFHLLISIRTYETRRNTAVTVLAMGSLLLVLTWIVSDRLLLG